MAMTELKAPKGKYRVVGVDTFDGTDWVQADVDNLQHALNVAYKEGDTMLMMHVYDDEGKHRGSAGTV